MAQSVELKARGLYTFFNDLSEVPPGALREALNVVIDRNGIIEPRRGLTQYNTAFGTSVDRAKQLIQYKNTVLIHYDDTLAYDNGTGFTDFSGTYEQIEEGLRIKSVEVNGNLYFTTKEGVKKISAQTSSDFTNTTGFITQSGGPKALDLSASPVYGTGGFLTPLSKAAYRIVWGITDKNDNLIIGAPSSRAVVENISSTDSARVSLTFSIPDEVDSTNFFYQVYRTGVFTAGSLALLDEIDPGEEMNLVLEDFVTSGQITAGSATVSDITPEDFRRSGALLYINPVSGEGIEQANEAPPFAKDITFYKGYTFYGNTSTVQRFSFSLLSIQDLVQGAVPSSRFTISDGVSSREYRFQGDFETYTMDLSGMSFPADKSDLDGEYFAIDSANGERTYKIWFDNTGSTVEPTLAGSLSIKVDISALSTGGTIAQEVADQIALATNDFNTSIASDVLDISCANNGAAGNNTVTIGGSFSLTTDSAGLGENLSTQRIFLARVPSTGENGPSIAQQVDQTARSLVRVINADTSKITRAFYLSGVNDVPGQILLEQVNVTGPRFSVTANTTAVGGEFNPAFPTTGTTVGSENESRPNRIYYSKFQQPEAVPLANFIDIGPKDEEIQRIIGLRDSLFVFKKDAIYRITGDVAPFQVAPFDSSAILLAPDSAVVLNNLIYGFSTQGVITVSDTGVSVISRPIENELLSITRSGFNFRNPTFAVSYETDRSYLLWTVTNDTDEVATQCFRFNSFTNTWTKWSVTASSGMVNRFDDKLYIGAGDSNFVERERKERTRKDFADRQFPVSIIANEVDSTTIGVSTTANVEPGDVILQVQYLTVSQFNRILNKIDTDPNMPNNYFSTLASVPGDALDVKLSNLVSKLNTDDTSTISETFANTDVNTGTDVISLTAHGFVNGDIVYITNPDTIPGGLTINTKYYIVNANTNDFQLSTTSGGSAIDITSQGIGTNTITNEYYSSGSTDFATTQIEFNNISEKLEISAQTFFSDYPRSSGTLDVEGIVNSVDTVNSDIILNTPSPYIAGTSTVFKSIDTRVTWVPQIFGDVSMTKQVREGTIIFGDNNFTRAKVSYSTDNSPSFEFIEFGGQGIGDWGQFPWGQHFWGGLSSSAPLRTLIPLQKQRCRFMVPRFEHNIAFENYALYGMSLTFKPVSTRGYR